MPVHEPSAPQLSHRHEQWALVFRYPVSLPWSDALSQQLDDLREGFG